ncbi:MAG: TetR/AcrR family transcriptional regulator [Micrococcaceae bacterium]
MHHISEHEDLRAQKSKQKVYDALTRLLKQQSFEKISVAEIIREAGISRGTFYHHFKDKSHLVETYMKSVLGNFRQENATLTQQNLEGLLTDIFSLHTKESALLAALLSDRGGLSVHHTIKSYMKKFATFKIAKADKNSTLTALEKDYISVFVVNAIFGVLQNWFARGQQETPAQMADIIKKIISPYVLRIIAQAS